MARMWEILVGKSTFIDAINLAYLISTIFLASNNLCKLDIGALAESVRSIANSKSELPLSDWIVLFGSAERFVLFAPERMRLIPDATKNPPLLIRR